LQKLTRIDISLSKAGKYGAGIKHPSPGLQVAKKKRSSTLSLHKINNEAPNLTHDTPHFIINCSKHTNGSLNLTAVPTTTNLTVN